VTIVSPVAVATAERLVREQFAIETGQLELAAGNLTADFVNHRAATEPPAARGHGPAALQATAEWLRTAFSDLRFEIHETAVIGDRAIAWVTLHGTQTGPFVGFDPADGSVANVFPPTGRSFAARQVHWFRIVDDAIAEHDAVRDGRPGRMVPATAVLRGADAAGPSQVSEAAHAEDVAQQIQTPDRSGQHMWRIRP
jgi:predicted ester cyclase